MKREIKSVIKHAKYKGKYVIREVKIHGKHVVSDLKRVQRNIQ